MKNSDQPAFANNIYKEFASDFKDGFGVMEGINPTGITKREYFAAKAMQGLLGNNIVKDLDLAKDMIASDAIAFADELLKQLEL